MVCNRRAAIAGIAAWFLSFGGLALVGCSDAPAPQPDVAKANQEAMERGAKALEGKDYATAEREFDSIQTGVGIDPEARSKLSTYRCAAWIGLDKIDLAEAELQKMEGGADMDQICIVRGLLALKKGDKAAARSAFTEAKKVNPAVKLPPEAG